MPLSAWSRFARRTRVRRSAASALLCLVPASAAASALPDDRESLLALLEEQTELATKTRLNADYVPGIVDILHGDELAGRGARTVWDALGFVPGLNPIIDQLGHRRVIVRGLGAIGDNWASGYVKVLLNGIEANTADKGLADPVYFIPIQQVERIEVIRGPGSALHGAYAVAGVINVVTQRELNRAFALAGSFGEIGGGALLHGRTGALDLSLSLSRMASDGADVHTGTDALHQSGLAAASNAPGRSDEKQRTTTVAARAEVNGWSLAAQWSRVRLGDFFGVNYKLPPRDDGYAEDSRVGQLEARYGAESAYGGMDLYAGVRVYALEKEDLFADPAEFYGQSEGPDVRVDVDYREAQRYWGADYRRVFGAHTLLAGVYSGRVEVTEAGQSVNLGFDPQTGPQVLEEPIEYGYPVPEGTRREFLSFTLQDEWRISEQLGLTGGLRYDDFSRVGTSLTPRIAGVWRRGEGQVFKAQYGRAFRPPTLTEAALGAPDLAPVTIDTAEIAYLRKHPRGEWRATAAYSQLDDIILFDPNAAPYLFDNSESGLLRSVELEGQLQATARLRVWGSLAYANAALGESDERIAGSSEWLGRVGLRYRLGTATNLNAELRHVSGFAREREDPRGEAHRFDTVDLTVTHRLGASGLLRLGVANLFDADVRYPAFLATDQGNRSVVSYPGDLPRPGRRWWLELSYGF